MEEEVESEVKQSCEFLINNTNMLKEIESHKNGEKNPWRKVECVILRPTQRPHIAEFYSPSFFRKKLLSS